MEHSLDILNLKTMKMFKKPFPSFHEQRKFMVKAKYSKEIKVIGFEYNGQQEYLELSKHM